MDVRAVIFDWGHTLARYEYPDDGHLWRDAARLLGPDHLDRLTECLVDVEASRWKGLSSDPSSWTLHDVIREACGECGLHPDEELLETAVRLHHRACLPYITHDPDTSTVLRALRDRGVGVGLVSNILWPGSMVDEVLNEHGLVEAFDVRVYTSDLPFHKPHHVPFRAALEALGVGRPSEAVFVGDRLYDDVFGAQRVGMRTVLRTGVRDTEEDGDHRGVVPDATIDSLPELLAIVEQWMAA